MRRNATLYYLLGDHLGSTSLTTNTSGAVVAELRYKAWGETRFYNGTTPTNYRYTGQREEPSFGLMFYNARWYDPYITQFSQPDSIVPNPYNSQDWDRYAYARNNPLRYTDPSGHLPWLIFAGLVAVDYLTFTGVLPDMKGTAVTVALADTNDATVAAGLAVQSEWLGPQDIPAVMSVYDRVTGTNDTHNYGLAQTSSSEMSSLGICEECNPWDLSLADDTIAARIQNGLKKCKLCDSGVDTLIASALAQNGFDTSLFNQLEENPADGTLNWEEFLNTYGGNPSDTVAKLRQGLTGDKYETELILKLYMNDLRLLLKLGYKLPKGITEADIKKVEEIIGNYK